MNTTWSACWNKYKFTSDLVKKKAFNIAAFGCRLTWPTGKCLCLGGFWARSFGRSTMIYYRINSSLGNLFLICFTSRFPVYGRYQCGLQNLTWIIIKYSWASSRPPMASCVKHITWLLIGKTAAAFVSFLLKEPHNEIQSWVLSQLFRACFMDGQSFEPFPISILVYWQINGPTEVNSAFSILCWNALHQ